MNGAKVAQLRREKGWSQQDLAIAAGLHVMTVSAAEREAKEPTVATLEALARALGVEIADLLAALPDAGEQSGAAAAEVRAPQAASGAPSGRLDAAAAPATTQRRAAS